jgi:hypothetical protein
MNDDRVDRTKESAEIRKQLKSNYGVEDSIKTEDGDADSPRSKGRDVGRL